MNTIGHRRCCVHDTYNTTYNTYIKTPPVKVANIQRYGDELLVKYFQTLRWDGLPASLGSNGTVVGLLLDPGDVGNTHL